MTTARRTTDFYRSRYEGKKKIESQEILLIKGNISGLSTEQNKTCPSINLDESEVVHGSRFMMTALQFAQQRNYFSGDIRYTSTPVADKQSSYSTSVRSVRSVHIFQRERGMCGQASLASTPRDLF